MIAQIDLLLGLVVQHDLLQSGQHFFQRFQDQAVGGHFAPGTELGHHAIEAVGLSAGPFHRFRGGALGFQTNPLGLAAGTGNQTRRRSLGPR